MFDFITGNLSTILVGAAITALLLLITIKMVRDKRKGKSSCGCGCANCPSAGRSCNSK